MPSWQAGTRTRNQPRQAHHEYSALHIHIGVIDVAARGSTATTAAATAALNPAHRPAGERGCCRAATGDVATGCCAHSANPGRHPRTAATAAPRSRPFQVRHSEPNGKQVDPRARGESQGSWFLGHFAACFEPTPAAGQRMDAWADIKFDEPWSLDHFAACSGPDPAAGQRVDAWAVVEGNGTKRFGISHDSGGSDRGEWLDASQERAG